VGDALNAASSLVELAKTVETWAEAVATGAAVEADEKHDVARSLRGVAIALRAYGDAVAADDEPARSRVMADRSLLDMHLANLAWRIRDSLPEEAASELVDDLAGLKGSEGALVPEVSFLFDGDYDESPLGRRGLAEEIHRASAMFRSVAERLVPGP